LLDRLRARVRVAALELPRRRVLEQEVDRLGRVLLVRADHPARAALDPAGAVDARSDAAALVRDRRAALVERHAREGDAEVADAAEHDPARDRLALVRRLRADTPALVGDQPVADDLDSLDLLLAEDRDRRDSEAENDRAALARGLALGVL